MTPEECPHCKKSFQGTEIPDEYRSRHGGTHYSLIIGVELRGVYDGTAYWQCPFCGWAFHRFPDTFAYFRKIDPFVKEIQDIVTSRLAADLVA